MSAKALAARNEVYGYADRFDEKYDLVRTLRQGKYTYIRNFQGFYPDALQNNYRYKMLAFTEWRELANAGKLNEAQMQFHRRRPAEQLFDVEADPHEVNNLANDPEYTKVLGDLRSRMQKKLREVNDLSFYPESFMVQNALQDGVTYGTANHKEINRLVDIADLALLPFAEAHKPLAAALKAKPPMELYWACTTASVIGEKARPLVPLSLIHI